MEIYILILVVVILIQTTYATYHLTSGRKNTAKNLTFIDSSVLIDGRIVSIAQSGFIPDGFVIPRSVIGELQFLADNADHEKRMRARHGLDVAHQLIGLDSVQIDLYQDSTKAEEGVDNRLLELAKKHSGSICTIDYNLNKVAKVEGIGVLNVNELNKDLRTAYLPGEQAEVAISQKGQDNSQGVGYLQDGTMVVVDNASRSIGKSIEVEFTRMLQTDAGRMMFAKPANGTGHNNNNGDKSPAVKSNKPAAGRGRMRSTLAAPKKTGTKHRKPVNTENRTRKPVKAASAPTVATDKRPKKSSASKPRRFATEEDKLMKLIDKQ